MTPTGKMISHGTISSIIEFKIPKSKEKVVGKVFKHDLQPENVWKIIERVNKISDFSNKNIVESKGICFIPDRIMPVLLMERMTRSLQSHIKEHNGLLTVVRKIGILRDIASGLHYLHSRNPPYIHGHLTTENVLLNDDCTEAKIGGFVIETTSHLPQNNMNHIPPEAQEGKVPSHPSFDIFSFGHLALVTILGTEITPLPFQCFNEYNEPVLRHEVVRRIEYIDNAHELLNNSEYGFMIGIIKKCLHNNPNHRHHAGALHELLKPSMFPFSRRHLLTNFNVVTEVTEARTLDSETGIGKE